MMNVAERKAVDRAGRGVKPQCRIFSRYLALQIKALEEGLLNEAAHS